MPYWVCFGSVFTLIFGFALFITLGECIERNLPRWVLNLYLIITLSALFAVIPWMLFLIEGVT